MLSGYQPECLGQFFLHGIQDNDAVSRCFQVSDRDALNAFLFRKKKTTLTSQTKQLKAKKIPHTCRNMVLRNIIWLSYRWWDKRFDNFINDFSPDVVLFQAGDSPFMFSIAYRISKRWNIPLVMYNSESYVYSWRLKRVGRNTCQMCFRQRVFMLSGKQCIGFSKEKSQHSKKRRRI